MVHGPRSATVGSSKSDVDVDRPVPLAVLARARLLDDADDRGEVLGERGLVVELGAAGAATTSAAVTSRRRHTRRFMTAKFDASASVPRHPLRSRGEQRPTDVFVWVAR